MTTATTMLLRLSLSLLFLTHTIKAYPRPYSFNMVKYTSDIKNIDEMTSTALVKPTTPTVSIEETSSAAVTEAEQNWPALKLTFGKYNDQPRTVSEAKLMGWVLMSECGSDTKFAGHRYADPGDPSLVILMDDAGYIAGVQSFVLEEYINVTLFDPSVNQAYNYGLWFGKPAWITTLYFVNPYTICNGGRSEKEWDTEGTGERLALQYGPTPADLINVPLSQTEAENEDRWFDHRCIPGMGDHWANFNFEINQDCGTVIPLVILYDSGLINGFMFFHFAKLPGDKWERPTPSQIRVIFHKPATCFTDLPVYPGLVSMHHYIHNNPQLTVCPTNDTVGK